MKELNPTVVGGEGAYIIYKGCLKGSKPHQENKAKATHNHIL